MTLLLAYADADFQVIAADRRLTPFDKIEKPTDELFKVACFVNETQAYRFAIGYTGFATDGATFDTLAWLVAALPACFGPTTNVIDGLAAIAAASTEKFATFGEEGRRLVTRLQLCGALTFADAGRRPFIAHVSNRAGGAAGAVFHTEIRAGRGAQSYVCDIMPPPTGGLSNPMVADIKAAARVMRRLTSYPAKVGTLVELIRERHAANPMGTVGPDVLAAWFEAHPNDPSKCIATGMEWAVDSSKRYRVQPPIIFASGHCQIDMMLSDGYIDRDNPPPGINVPNLKSKVPRKPSL